jgi:hypothetical protein
MLLPRHLERGQLQTLPRSFQKNLNNQYYLVFLGEPKKKGALQRIKIWTEKSNSEIAAPDTVWIPGLQDKDNDKNK